ILSRVVPEVHVDGIAVDLVADAAAPAVKVILPLGHSWDGATLGDPFWMPKGTDGGQVRRDSTQPGADDVGDPELTLTVPDQADQGPRFPRRRQRAGIGQSPKEGGQSIRRRFLGTCERGK